jgi:K+-transporting ATPase ATPase C chain
MWRQIVPAFRMALFFTVLTGFVYPGLVTALCQVFFHNKANGSLVQRDAQAVGSSLIGQNFSTRIYFHPRPSAAGDVGYDASASNASNYGPTNQKLVDRVKANIKKFRQENPDYHGPIPTDLVTTSASGLDPDISPASALAQAPRVAEARSARLDQVEQLIAARTRGRQLGFLGEPRVSVLEPNLALDREFPCR